MSIINSKVIVLTHIHVMQQGWGLQSMINAFYCETLPIYVSLKPVCMLLSLSAHLHEPHPLRNNLV